MDYITIICDIKSSSLLNNREDIQLQLISTLKELNNKFADQIASPFLITLGDEWQGLLHENGDYQQIIDFLAKKLSVSFYTGIGIGEISISNFELTVNQLDGPSFHKARKAIKLTKKLGYSLVLIK